MDSALAIVDAEKSTNSSNESTWDLTSDYPVVSILICLGYFAITLCGFFGNSLVVLVVVRKKSMQSITNLFILNLALSDLLMSIISTPMTPVAFFMEQWELPGIFCQLLPMTMAMSVYVSSWTSIAIAYDRYRLIVHPFQLSMTKRRCFYIISGVWFIASLLSCPYAVHHQYNYNRTENKSECFELWSSPEVKRVFDLTSFILQFVVPVILIALCYSRIGTFLRNHQRVKANMIKNRSKEEADVRRQKRTNRMLVLMVIIFILCWVPFSVIIVLLDAMTLLFPRNFPYTNFIFLMCHLLAMSCVVYNPFLYGWMNDNFRREFHLVLPFLLRKRASTAVGVEEPYQERIDHNEELPLKSRTTKALRETEEDQL